MSFSGTIQLKNRLGLYQNKFFLIQDKSIKYYRNENAFHLKKAPLGIFNLQEISLVHENSSDGVDVLCVELLLGAFKLLLRTHSVESKQQWLNHFRLLGTITPAIYVPSQAEKYYLLLSALSRLPATEQVRVYIYCL
jgi:hypothetical protein